MITLLYNITQLGYKVTFLRDFEDKMTVVITKGQELIDRASLELDEIDTYLLATLNIIQRENN